MRQFMLDYSTTNEFADCEIFYQMDRLARLAIQSFFSASPEDSGKTQD
jgi:hypothetical protein